MSVAGSRARLPWALYGLMLLVLAVTLTLTMLNGTFDPFVTIAVGMMLGYGTMGAIVASRAPRNPLGWLMLMIGVGFVLVGLSDELLVYLLATNPNAAVGAGLLRTLAAWIGSWVFFLVWTPIPLILLLFPTGRLASRRWRPVARVIAIAGGLTGALAMLSPEPIEAGETGLSVENPFGLELLRPVVGIGWAVGLSLLAVATIAAVVGLILRFRRASGEERQQIRWLAYLSVLAIVLLASTVVSGVLFSREGQPNTAADILGLAFFACIGIALPVAMAIAILRFRLYDLDVVVKRTVVAFLLVGAITAISFLLVIAVPLLIIGIGGDVGSMVPVAFGIAVGIAMTPLRRRARRFADRIVYGARATPYEVLSEFAERMGGTYSSEDVLPRMAQLLAQGTGAGETVVWLQVGGELRPVAHWPADGSAPDEPSPDAERFAVDHQGERLGIVTLQMPANDPMNPTKERLVRDVAGQASLVLRNVRLIEDLRESRRRIVSAQDERARALERNIHDGAQQQLVALSVKLRLVDGMLERDAVKAREVLAQLQTDTNDTLEDLRDLARGIYPPLLADKGLAAALEAQARRAAVRVTVEADGVERYPQEIESAVYFSVLEALNNVAKYAGTEGATVTLAQANGNLTFTVRDEGTGFDTTATSSGTGLQGITDRLDAIGGRLEVRSAPGQGTTVVGRVPSTPHRGSG